MKRLLFLYPVLFAAYAPLTMLAQNLNEVPLREGTRALVVSIVVGVLALLLAWLLFRDGHKAALMVLLPLLAFFSYGHLYNVVRNMTLAGVVVGRHRYLLPLAATLLGLWTWWLARRRVSPQVTQLLALVIGLLAVVPIYQIIVHRGAELAEAAASLSREVATSRAGQGQMRPDIYYIVLDGYGRSDVLRDLYGFDDSRFIDFLRSQDFYVATESHTNYSATLASLASTLNMTYIDGWPERDLSDSLARQALERRIRDNEVRRRLEREGYRVVAFETGIPFTEWPDADIFLQPDTVRGPLNAFEVQFVESTALRAATDLYFERHAGYRSAVLQPEYEAHRLRVQYTLSSLGRVARMQGDFFVFAHVVSPHPPFVFGSHGERLPATRAYRVVDGDDYPGGREEYLRGYRDQAIYIARVVQETIQEILENSETPPIIILQSDHGPGGYLHLRSVAETYLPERFSILNAYFFPDGDYQNLYPTITPVNSFRVLFNRYFGGDEPLLADRSYFVALHHVFDLTEVTDALDQPLPELGRGPSAPLP